jgi:hypothetical protein
MLRRSPMLARCLSLFLLLFAGCTHVRDWREMQTDPMPIGECYEGVSFIANAAGFQADAAASDRGHGIWQSRWRSRTLEGEKRHRARFRLYLEIDVDKGSAIAGWPIRYVIEQQWIEDLRRERSPKDDDWDWKGQDKEAEAIFGERLMRRVAPKSVQIPERRT